MTQKSKFGGALSIGKKAIAKEQGRSSPNRDRPRRNSRASRPPRARASVQCRRA